MKLTKENYHTTQNTAISCSKIKDFRASPQHFWEKHVSHETSDDPTDAMKLGSMVDAALTAGTLKAIDDGWQLKMKKPTKTGNENYEAEIGDYQWQKENPEKIATDTMLEKAFEMARAILELDWYKEDAVRKPHYQAPILGRVGDMEVCFMPDHYILETTAPGKMRITITDWKTSAPSDVTNKWRWINKCRSYGYFMQFAMCKLIFTQLFPKHEIEFVFRHAVIESQKNGRYHDHLFIIPESYIVDDYWTIVHTVREIQRCITIGKDAFVDPSQNWNMATVL